MGEAFRVTSDLIREVPRTGQWGRLAEPLTPDGTYRITGRLDIHGRDAVRTHFEAVGTTFPGTLIAEIEPTWHVVDEAARRVVFEVLHVLRDPGDGSRHYASTTCLMLYAGEGRWSYIEDTFSPNAYRVMYRSWLRHAQQCGDLDPDATRLLHEVEHAADPVVRPVDASLEPTGARALHG